MNWTGWPLERVSILLLSFAFLLIGIQVTLFHYRQNFHHKAMWLPVLAAPLFFIVGGVFAFYRAEWLGTLFLSLMWVGLVAGLIGFYFHFRGVGIRVGGWALRNFLIGPPIILPLMFTAMSTLALIVMYWRE